MLSFTTKADTLRALSGRLKTARVLPQVCLNVEEAQADPQQSLILLRQAGLLGQRLIVRSSAKNEDTAQCSNAGKFLSIADVAGEKSILKAVEQVIEAMGHGPDNQVFIQPFLTHVELCGVAFTMDPNTGGNYYILNYDDSTGSTSSVTDGTGAHLQTFYHFKGADVSLTPQPLDRVIALCRELEELFQHPALDLEFAIAGDELYLLQVRPLVMTKPSADLEEQTNCLQQIQGKLRSCMLPHPDLCGKKTIYGVMPDWNPAEMIGLRPRALALSLYKEIITDGVWAYQRDNYGYRNLRSFPLMVDFRGLPYIDTRVSFNSFLPKVLPDALSEKLVDYYLDRLCAHPEYHDKVEFEIAFTCYTFDLPERVKALDSHGFTAEEQDCLVRSLREMTNSIIQENGLWRKDAEKIEILQEKHQEIMNSGLGTVDKIYWLLEYCKRYGTLPFAGLARAGFIAVELLRSMVAVGGITEEERLLYMSGLSTVGKNITRDLAALSPAGFLSKYGHLRPGTYDICSPRYDQGRELYFDFARAQNESEATQGEFKLTLKQYEFFQHMLEEHQLKVDVLSLFHFIQHAIEGREYAKFVFTHTLSDVLELLVELGAEYGFTREDMSYVTIQRVTGAYSSANDLEKVLRDSIRDGRARELESAAITLPPLLWDETQVYSFFLPDGSPNFITQGRCTAETVLLPSEDLLEGKLVLIRGADPGYDWIFSHSIAGFITAYGGANSHMAIRAAEFGIPAVIGVGEKQFARYAAARCLEVDCRNRTVAIL
ncbi:MAG: phosphoenolpyruvate synthase [Clostridiales bacterium]|nr:phosphoenolpyruvate synthase [Clostridiales bacterium]